MASQPGEVEDGFRGRLGQAMREKRDLAVEKVRRKYERRFTTLKNRQMRAEQAVSREKEQARSRKVETAISFGSALLGAFLGRKTVSARSTYRMGSALKSAGRMQKEKMDVARAKEMLTAVQAEMAALEAQFEADVAGIEASLDPATIELDEVLVKAKCTDITLEIFGLAWMPFRRGAGGGLQSDWI